MQQAASATERTELIGRVQKRHFAACDAVLDQAGHGPTWLREASIAELLMREIHALAELGVVILAYCLMANHVYLLVQLPEIPGFSASRMMQR